MPISIDKSRLLNPRPGAILPPSGLACYGYYITYVTVLRDAKGKIIKILSVKDGGFLTTHCDEAKPQIRPEPKNRNLLGIDKNVLSDCIGEVFGLKLLSYKEPQPGSANSSVKIDDGGFGIGVSINATTYTSEQIYNITWDAAMFVGTATQGTPGTYYIGSDVSPTNLPFQVAIAIGEGIKEQTHSSKGGAELFECIVKKGGVVKPK